jgi:hypothetical protein
VKIPNGFLVMGDQDDGCPDGMAKHQKNGQQAGDAVHIERHLPGNFAHQGGAGGVEHEADPEQHQVPGFQAAGKALAPDADGIKNQCKNNRDNR